MIERTERIEKFIADFTKEKIAQKYLYKFAHLSGSSTMVYPIEIYKNNNYKDHIIFQWNSNKRIFDKFIDRIVKNNSDLILEGRFWKSDGSCPSTITFYLR